MTVDVFTATPYKGNPVAVVLDAEGLDTAQMQAFARWTNLSETTFVLPPSAAGRAQGADYQVRIFTPAGELAFAGHPTLGTCHAWLAHAGTAQHPQQIVQECAKGLVAVRRQADASLAFAAPSLERRAVDTAQLAPILQALGLHADQVLAAQDLYNGSPWLGLLLDSPDTVLGVQPDFGRLQALNAKVGLAARYVADQGAPLIARSSREARAFAAPSTSSHAPMAVHLEVRGLVGETMSEDPVTGSLNAALAQWLTAEGWLTAPYTANQGACVGRDGWVRITQDAQQQFWVGGQCVTCVQGQVFL